MINHGYYRYPFRIFKCFFLGLAISLLITNLAHATVMPGWWIAVEGGYSSSLSGTHTVAEPMEQVSPTYDYYISNAPQNSGLAGIGGGYQFMLPRWKEWFPSDRLGIFYNYYFPATITGNIYKYQSSTAVYGYQYKAASNVLWLDNQLDVISWNHFTPFMDLALGSAFNTASNYSENSIIQSMVRPSAGFSNYTSTAFAWRIGAGVNYALHWKEHTGNISLEYRYSNLGDVSTGSAAAIYPTLTQGLSQHITNNEVVLGLRYTL